MGVPASMLCSSAAVHVVLCRLATVPADVAISTSLSTAAACGFILFAVHILCRLSSLVTSVHVICIGMAASR